jgi:hypothetical protein
MARRVACRIDLTQPYYKFDNLTAYELTRRNMVGPGSNGVFGRDEY